MPAVLLAQADQKEHVWQMPRFLEGTLTHVTEAVENAPPGTKAKLVCIWDGKTGLEQSFHMAFPGREFSCYSTNRMTRSR